MRFFSFHEGEFHGKARSKSEEGQSRPPSRLQPAAQESPPRGENLIPSESFRERPVPSKDLILDFSEYDLDHVVADIEEIRRYNPQRFEMEQLTAIVYDDVETRHLRRLQGRHGQ